MTRMFRRRVLLGVTLAAVCGGVFATRVFVDMPRARRKLVESTRPPDAGAVRVRVERDELAAIGVPAARPAGTPRHRAPASGAPKIVTTRIGRWRAALPASLPRPPL